MFIETLISKLETFHLDAIKLWKKDATIRTQQELFKLIEENHAFNFQLWHAEDRARRDDMGFEYVYHAKREIDHCNQQRNNRMEMMDEYLFHHIKPANASECPVHSETPGMMIDRLSILALKQYHMALQTERKEAEESHRQSCLAKLQVIELQKCQLLSCLDEFLKQILNRQRTFKIYHQFKMYNDPTLNPHLYDPSLKPVENNDASS